MKRKLLFFFTIVLFTFGVQMIFNFTKTFAKTEPSGHVVYDYYDRVYRCLGSPFNC